MAKFLENFISIYILSKFIIISSLTTGLIIAIRAIRSENKISSVNKYKIDRSLSFKKLLVFIIIWVLSIIFSYFIFKIFDDPLFWDYSFDSLLFSPFIILTFYYWIIFWDNQKKIIEDEYLLSLKDFELTNKYWVKYKNFYLSNLIKIIFIPYIYGAVNLAITKILTIDFGILSTLNLIQFLFYFGICCDVIIALGGYVFSSKILGTETVSVDETWEGWVVCLICYPPLLSIYRFFSEQTDNYIWTNWLQPNDFLYWIWAFLICLSWCLYWLSTLSFGFKFSNLSWRGLVNTGLYKYMRHPAYFSKNVYWWLHTVPFFGVIGLDMLRNFLALSFVSLIYYLRAKTEEKHLLKFKEYQEYYIWIENYGLWAKIKKKIKKS